MEAHPGVEMVGDEARFELVGRDHVLGHCGLP